MNRIFSAIPCIILTATLALSCAKSESVNSNVAAKKQIEAWISLNHPEAVQTSMGCYILEDTPGSGVYLEDPTTYPYFAMTYTATTLDGSITESTSVKINQQLGAYDSTYFYGPLIGNRGYSSTYEAYMIPVGLEEAISTMRVGGHRKFVVPGWLMSYSRYDTTEGYFNNETSSHMIYDLTVTDAISDIFQYQVDSIERYMTRELVKVDSLVLGLYYIQTVPPTDTTAIDAGTTVYANYTGRLLNGRIFDTTDKDLSKINGLYNSSRTYGKVAIRTSESYSDYTIGESDSSEGSTMIEGFAYILSQMRTGEQGIVIFDSTLGYGESGNGTSIPGYSPLRFDIEYLGKKEE